MDKVHNYFLDNGENGIKEIFQAHNLSRASQYINIKLLVLLLEIIIELDRT